MFKVITDTPVALDSPDHIQPWGTKQDNSSNAKFLDQIEALFGKPVKVMDIGCSGGQMIKDFFDRGNMQSIGLEGSDWSVVNARKNWPELHNTHLFTADVTKPFQVLWNDEPIKFNCITAWAHLEHIKTSDLALEFANVCNHLEDDGIFVGNCGDHHLTEVINGVKLHQTCLPEEQWYPIIDQFFERLPWPTGWIPVRQDPYTFLFYLKKKKNAIVDYEFIEKYIAELKAMNNPEWYVV